MLDMKKIVLITLISAGLTTGAFAKDFGGKHGTSKSRHMGSPMHMLKRLDLTDAQTQQIKAIFQAVKQQIQLLRKQMQPLRKQLKTLSQATVYDQYAVSNVAEQIAALKKSKIEIMTKARNQAWNILTPAQKQKATELEKKRKEKHQKRKQKKQAKKSS